MLLVAGVWLNGHQFKQGNHCVYLPRVSRRYNQQGAGGLDGSSTSHRVATIGMFYTFIMHGGGDRSKRATFVSITDRPVKHKVRSMYIIDSVRCDTSLQRFGYVHSDANTLIFIDSITSKLKLVPHYLQSKQDELMCGIPMWDAR